MPDKWKKRFDLLHYFAYLAIGAVVFGFVAAFTSGIVERFTTIFAFLFAAPLLVWAYILTIWHWKDRYIGRHSDLWGAILLIETSSWFKLIYLFRHIIPDTRGTGRYLR